MKPHDKYTDEELLARYKQTGNSEHFGVLYNRYIPLIYGLCLKYLKNITLAEDAVMDIFEDILPKVQRYDIREFRTWIYTVARHHALAAATDSKQTATMELIPEIVQSSPTMVWADADDTTDREQMLEECMQQLPDVQRVAIQKFYFEGKSYADIVDETGLHLKSVKSYIQNGKRNLRICIEKRLKR